MDTIFYYDLLSQFTMAYYSENHINQTILILHAVVTFTIVGCFYRKEIQF